MPTTHALLLCSEPLAVRAKPKDGVQIPPQSPAGPPESQRGTEGFLHWLWVLLTSSTPADSVALNYTVAAPEKALTCFFTACVPLRTPKVMGKAVTHQVMFEGPPSSSPHFHIISRISTLSRCKEHVSWSCVLKHASLLMTALHPSKNKLQILFFPCVPR